ncbi:hypothetical protein RB531_4764 [Salmonella enterica subsp. enterica serovar Typhimurium]
MQTQDTFYQVMRRHGVTRRSFLKFCSLTATSLGLSSSMIPQIAYALENKPRTPVIWLHGLECTCCTESFIRSAHPLAKDAILSLISLDYDDTIMAAAGQQAEQALADVMREYKGNYIVAVEGNAPLNEDGMFCILAGEPFLEKLKRVSADAKAIIAWGSCASWGCVQAARPNPTKATPVHKLITDKPIIKVPGCPPIPEVMSAVITYMLAFDRIPPLDRLGRPKMFYGQRIHDKCYRRAHFDAGQFVEAWDDEGARKGIACTRWAVKARPPITPVQPFAGMMACLFLSSRVMDASDVRKMDSGITVLFTAGQRAFRKPALRLPPIKSDWALLASRALPPSLTPR